MEDDNDNDWIALVRRALFEDVGGGALARATLGPADNDEYGMDPSDTDSDDAQDAQTTRAS